MAAKLSVTTAMLGAAMTYNAGIHRAAEGRPVE
jgi:hypothetical protein